ncbi:MAG: hypothetical protein ACYDCK_02430 [Thermoplasmatota archaeon]
MDFDAAKVATVVSSVDSFIDSTFDGIIANLTALEHAPSDRLVRQRIFTELAELERLVVVRAGLAVISEH